MLYDKRAVSLKDKLMEQDREAKELLEKEAKAKKKERGKEREKVEVKNTKKKK